MKKLIFTTFLSLAMMISMTAQVADTTHAQTKEKTKTSEQVKTHTANHGQAVSTVAIETPSGSDKGQTVSTEAKTQGVAQKAENQKNKETKSQAKTNETPKAKNPNAKGIKGARPASTDNHIPTGGPKAVAPGKK